MRIISHDPNGGVATLKKGVATAKSSLLESQCKKGNGKTLTTL